MKTFPSPKHKATPSCCAWVHLFRRDHSAGEQASPSRFIALKSTHSPTRPRYVHHYFTMTQQQSTRHPRACRTPSPVPSLLCQAAPSHRFRHYHVGWHCWCPAPSSKALGNVMLCGKTKQGALGIFASLAAHRHALPAAAHLSELTGTREARCNAGCFTSQHEHHWLSIAASHRGAAGSGAGAASCHWGTACAKQG